MKSPSISRKANTASVAEFPSRILTSYAIAKSLQLWLLLLYKETVWFSHQISKKTVSFVYVHWRSWIWSCITGLNGSFTFFCELSADWKVDSIPISLHISLCTTSIISLLSHSCLESNISCSFLDCIVHYAAMAILEDQRWYYHLLRKIFIFYCRFPKKIVRS